MTSPSSKLPEIAAATERLLGTTRSLSDADIQRPSLLPDWTVGHVLSHIARNADSLVNLATWARTGVRTPQYASPEARDADIEAGATRSAAEIAEDVAASATRLQAALEAMPPEAWAVEVEWRGGARKAVGAIPSARLTEVEVHHADLGLDYGFGDIPEEHRLRLLADAIRDVPVYAEDLDRSWPETAGRGPSVVRGSSGDLLGWAAGRTKGENLSYDGELPAIPEWR